MGYFGSAYGSNWSANSPSAGNMMYVPNQYGGYSTLAAGTPDYRQASYAMNSMRNMMGGGGGSGMSSGYNPMGSLSSLTPTSTGGSNTGGGNTGGGAPSPLSYMSGLFSQYGAGGSGSNMGMSGGMGSAMGGGMAGGGRAVYGPMSFHPGKVAATKEQQEQWMRPTMLADGYAEWKGQKRDLADPNFQRVAAGTSIPFTTRTRDASGLWSSTTQKRNLLDYLKELSLGQNTQPTTP
jgi:hypothetical protein